MQGFFFVVKSSLLSSAAISASVLGAVIVSTSHLRHTREIATSDGKERARFKELKRGVGSARDREKSPSTSISERTCTDQRNMHMSRVQRSAQSPFTANPITHESQWARARDRTHTHIYTPKCKTRGRGGGGNLMLPHKACYACHAQ